jgi:predicted O-methyltransferase YrrM
MVQLCQGFTPRAPMPSSGDFALNPTDLLELLHLIRIQQPQLVVELGSGTSTVWIAYALEKIGGRLVSLDHDAGYAAKTRAMLAAHGLSGVAEVREAPLTPFSIEGKSYPWYDVAQLADLRGIDLLLVDGPPEATGPAARFPALHALEQRLSGMATIVIDDANRQGELAALASWTATFAGLSRERELLGRHAVLSYRRSGQPAPVPS